MEPFAYDEKSETQEAEKPRHNGIGSKYIYYFSKIQLSDGSILIPIGRPLFQGDHRAQCVARNWEGTVSEPEN